MSSTLNKLLSEITDQLIDKLPWLDAAFGQAERLNKEIDGRKTHFPGIYLERPGICKNDYMGLFPDSKIGNFSFFWMLDPKSFSGSPRLETLTKSSFALIFWVDLRKVSDSEFERNRDGLMSQILRVLTKDMFLTSGNMTINKVYELPENIYKEFTISEIDNQFLMHPYVGFRFEGILTYYQSCL